MPAAKSGSGNGRRTSTVTVLAFLAVFSGAFWSGGPNLPGKALAFEASMQVPARLAKVKVVMKSGAFSTMAGESGSSSSTRSSGSSRVKAAESSTTGRAPRKSRKENKPKRSKPSSTKSFSTGWR